MKAPPATYYEMLSDRLPGHGERVDELQARGILLDGTTEGGTQRLLLQIFSETLLGPVFFEFIQRKGDDGFGEGNFKALFESLERDQLRRGVIEAQLRHARVDCFDSAPSLGAPPALCRWRARTLHAHRLARGPADCPRAARIAAHRGAGPSDHGRGRLLQSVRASADGAQTRDRRPRRPAPALRVRRAGRRSVGGLGLAPCARLRCAQDHAPGDLALARPRWPPERPGPDRQCARPVA